MSQPLRKRMNKNLNMTAFTDVRLDNVGSSAFVISELNVQDYSNTGNFGHDYFTSQDLTIYTGAGSTGTQLVENTDYIVSEENTKLTTAVTNAVGSTKNVYKKVQIINASYQTGTLYVNGNWIGDDNNCDDLINVTPLLVSKSVAYTQTDKLGYPIFSYTCGTATKKHTLPTVADNKNARVKIIKADSGYGPVLVDGEGSETINGLTHIFLWSQYDCVELVSTGIEWVIINDFKPYFYSGWVSRSDWTNVHLGFATITYDTPSSADPFVIGDKVLGANGSYGICIYHSATILVIANCVSVGATVFANNEALSGDLSSATALVDMASGLKNIDSNVYYGWSKNLNRLFIDIYYSTSASDANSFYAHNITSSTNNIGLSYFQVDTNNVKAQVGSVGIDGFVDDAGTGTAITNQDWFYNIYVKLIK